MILEVREEGSLCGGIGSTEERCDSDPVNLEGREVSSTCGGVGSAEERHEERGEIRGGVVMVGV